MKISDDTLNIMQTFSRINNSMYIEKGNVIKVHPPTGSGSPVVRAVVDEEFPVGFGLGDVSQFLSVVKLFKQPDFKFGEKSVIISSATRQSTFRYTEETVISHPPYDKDIVLKEIDVELELDVTNIQDVIKSGRLLHMPHVMFKGDGKKVIASCYNKNLPASQRDFQTSFSVDVGEHDKPFTAVFDSTALTFVMDDAKMFISLAGVAHFKMGSVDLWVAAENVK